MLEKSQFAKLCHNTLNLLPTDRLSNIYNITAGCCLSCTYTVTIYTHYNNILHFAIFIIIPYKTSEDCKEQEDCRMSLIEDILHKLRKSVASLMFIATDLINHEVVI